MASNFLKEQRGAVSSFWDREVSTRLSDSYHWLENQAAGYWGLIEKSGWKPKGTTMARRIDAQPYGPELSPARKLGLAIAALALAAGMCEALIVVDRQYNHGAILAAVQGITAGLTVDDGQSALLPDIDATRQKLIEDFDASATAAVVEVYTATPRPATETVVFTATATQTPTAEATKDTYRQSLTAEQQAVYDAAPSQAGLEKQFLPGGLSEYLGYQDGSGEVTAIYDPERQKVFPALLNGDGNLFINEGSTGSPIVYNPKLERDEAVNNAGLVMDYVRARLCARALGMRPPSSVEEITPFMESISGRDCNVTLRAVSERINNPYLPEAKDWSYSVPRQTITITDQTPIVVRFTDSEEGLGEKGKRQMYLTYGIDLETKRVKQVRGSAIKQSGEGNPIEMILFHKGGSLPPGYDHLAPWLNFAISATFDRAGVFQDLGQRDSVLETILLNDWNSPKGADGIYDGFQISPLTFGKKLPS